jgi:hypothetical protein
MKEHSAYQEWLHLQVSHWAALDILSSIKSPCNTTSNVAISLLAVPHPKITEEVLWKEMIQELFPQAIKVNESSTADAQSIIDLICEMVKECRTNGKQVDSILYAFKDESQTIQFNATSHCEALLVSLLACLSDHSVFPEEEGNSALKAFMQVRALLH